MPNMITKDIDLYYELYGEGAPLMLVAGLASDSQSWQPIVKELSRYYRLIIPDNRGVGRTMPQNVETSIRHITDDCIALIRYMGLSSVNLLGHSMGGFVALDCAIRYPEHVSKLILAGTSACCSERNNALLSDWSSYMESGMNPELWFRNIFYWIFSRRFFEDKEALDNALRFAIEYPYPQTEIGFKNQVNAIKAFDCRDALHTITSETMVICGKEDQLIPPEESTEVLHAIPGAIFSFVEHAGHSIDMEKPMEFINIVRDFLSCREP
ncbi:alpha/beta fold hydrolase [Desulfonema magnum]|uniref:Alpha/beta hydrolase fold-containing protein n=1 Tax=Desulfonema magnum TaxID=45655 RepID=A0A975BHY5_9BACT|nr:alpha/beta hydrolase [Desulfonema magnum]QTA85628.1 Alpha/beta hydrolase fold-containing protein [Desulfonema magnum]